MKKKMKKSKKLLIAAICFLLIGAGVLLYPTVVKWFTSLDEQKVIDQFNQRVEGYRTEMNLDTDIERETLSEKEKEDERNGYDPELLNLLYKLMVKYNKDLVENGQEILDPFTYEKESFDLAAYSVYDKVFGYIDAPSINLHIPIYLGSTVENMALGATHMTGTSMAIGGENTNAVFAAHRGMIGATMFDNIVNLNKGDSVYITNLWYELEYKVVKTEVIYPNESNKTKIQEGKDMITLFTCHPYGYSDYRYIVFCERV